MKMLTDKTNVGVFDAFSRKAIEAWAKKFEPEKPEEIPINMICFKSEKKIIYFSTPNGKHHFVPAGKWHIYMKLRHETPKTCQIYSKVQDARGGAIDYCDGGLTV